MSSKSLSKNILSALKNLNIGDKTIIISNTVLFLKIKDIRNVGFNKENIENIKTNFEYKKKSNV